MALPDISLPGAINNTGVEPTTILAAQLKVWSGELIVAFERINVLANRHMVKRITTGKEAQFPGLGRAASGFHVRGTNLMTDASNTTAFNTSETIVKLDRPQTAHTFVDEEDDLMNHWETQSRYNKELGETLGRDRELFSYRALARSARSTTASNPNAIPADLGDPLGAGGFVTVGGGAARSSAQLLTSLIAAAQIFDDKSVPRDGNRWCPVTPTDYWLLVQNTDLLNIDFGNSGNGILAAGDIKIAAGMNLLMSTGIPSDNPATPTGARNGYVADFTTTVTVCFYPDAIASVWRMDPQMSASWKDEAQATFLLAKLMAGTNVGRPASAVEIGETGAQSAFVPDP